MSGECGVWSAPACSAGWETGRGAGRDSAGPQRHIVPYIGSHRWEGMNEAEQEGWEKLHATPCIFCGRPIVEQMWMLEWPDGRVCHMGCQEDAIQAERELASNPWWSEQAAAAGRMTIQGFAELPSWERLRRIKAVMVEATEVG